MATTTKPLVDINDETMVETIKQIKEYENMIEQAKQIVEELKASVKENMNLHNTDKAAYGPYKCTISQCKKSTFDKKLVLTEAPELYERACGESSYTRFTIS